ncbi:hypothetical protein ACFL96_19525 [Thermoproteota archaeon]
MEKITKEFAVKNFTGGVKSKIPYQAKVAVDIFTLILKKGFNKDQPFNSSANKDKIELVKEYPKMKITGATDTIKADQGKEDHIPFAIEADYKRLPISWFVLKLTITPISPMHPEEGEVLGPPEVFIIPIDLKEEYDEIQKKNVKAFESLKGINDAIELIKSDDIGGANKDKICKELKKVFKKDSEFNKVIMTVYEELNYEEDVLKERMKKEIGMEALEYDQHMGYKEKIEKIHAAEEKIKEILDNEDAELANVKNEEAKAKHNFIYDAIEHYEKPEEVSEDGLAKFLKVLKETELFKYLTSLGLLNKLFESDKEELHKIYNNIATMMDEMKTLAKQYETEYEEEIRKFEEIQKKIDDKLKEIEKLDKREESE